MRTAAPQLEPRDKQLLLAALQGRLPGYTPSWKPAPGGPGAAVLDIYARFLQTLAERINAAPDKNELAFLDLLGIDLVAARPARAPVVFDVDAGAGDGRAPAGTRIGAKGGDPETPIVFETERTIALTPSRLAEVVSVWPGRDAYADHSADAIGDRPFTLWEPLERVPHYLYVGHDLHFALSGPASVALRCEFAQPGGRPLELDWEWWDGEGWRAFKRTLADDVPGESFDGTGGLTRSGVVRLTTDCGASKQRAVGGWTKHWLRARPARALPPEPGRRLPELDRIVVETVIDRRLPQDDCSAGLLPEAMFAGGESLDPSKPFFPLGRAPSPDVAFYLSFEEAFSKPEASVEVCFERPKTEQEKADEEADKLAADVTSSVKHVVDAAKQAASAVEEAARAVIGLAPANDAGAATVNGLLPGLQASAGGLVDMSGLDALAGAAAQVADAAVTVAAGLPQVSQSVVDEGPTRTRMQNAAFNARSSARESNETVSVLTALTSALNVILSAAQEVAQARRCATAVLRAGRAIESLGRAGALPGLLTNLQNKLNTGNALDWESAAQAVVDDLDTGVAVDVVKKTIQAPDVNAIQNAKARARAATRDGSDSLVELAKLSPLEAALAAGAKQPELDPGVLEWEYWNGRGWRPLGVSASDAANLHTSGRIEFQVPDDWERSEVNDQEGRWLRARIASGTYGRLTLVSWKDQDHQVHYMSLIEPRPPRLDRLFCGYYFESEPAPPERCLTLNDWSWEDRTREAGWRGTAFAPFRPVADPTPALYLGFDGPLPADTLGLFADVEENGTEDGPELAWERWDGAAWRRVPVEDETRRLAVPGLAYVSHPGDARPQPAQVLSAEGRTIRLLDSRSAARFAAGDLVWLRAGDRGELARVAGVAGADVETEAPLSEAVGQAELVRAGLPRFGRPRSWLRARLHADGEPRRSRLNGLHANATWAANIETLQDELLGSSNGEPRQAFFFTRTPVLADELVEVRELEGGRAHVEYPLLVESLAAQGISEDELRCVREPRTDRVTEVWVPWRWRTSLAFSAPDARHYTLERSRGRLLFGDGVRGAIPPAGADCVRARRYRSGGGEAGNLAAGKLDQLLSGVVAAGVTSPRPAGGGAESEPATEVLERGPLMLRHRRQAVSAADAEALALECSRAVALAHARSRGARIELSIVPRSKDPRPAPTYELRRQVRDFVGARMPAAAQRLEVVGPRYVPVGVSATLVPVDPDAGGEPVELARRALAGFLHPLTGGPDGRGWPNGRDLHLSDVAVILEALEGVDHVESLTLLVDGSPAGDHVEIAADRLVCAGTINVELGGPR